MNKILVVMQYWEGDRVTAEQTLSLMRDLGPYEDLHLMLSRRFDAEPLNRHLMSELSLTFPRVLEFQGRRKSTGHPAAPNAMWQEVMTHVGMLHREGTMDYSGVFTIEPDVVPIVSDWEARVVSEWDARPQGTNVLGYWSATTNARFSKQVGHINGNMLVVPRIVVNNSTLSMTPSAEAWDTWHAATFQKLGWHHSTVILNRYRETALSDKDIEGMVDAGVALVHGVKDESIFSWVRKKLFTP